LLQLVGLVRGRRPAPHPKAADPRICLRALAKQPSAGRLGNALRAQADPALSDALQARLDDASPLLREHIEWALAQSV
jgi:hypothetical protein